jgi:hypothetical protein
LILIGLPWTFDNKQKGDRNVKVRLDRAVASPAWSAIFPEHRLHHLVSSRSDHCPILLSADTGANVRPNRPIRRYEIVWEREPSLSATVEEAWSRRVPVGDLGDVAASLSSMMSSLYSWKREHFKSVPKEIEKKRAQLEALQTANDDDSILARTGLEKEMDELLYREEILRMYGRAGPCFLVRSIQTLYKEEGRAWLLPFSLAHQTIEANSLIVHRHVPLALARAGSHRLATICS